MVFWLVVWNTRHLCFNKYWESYSNPNCYELIFFGGIPPTRIYYVLSCQCCSPILFLFFVYGHIFVRYVETGQPMSTSHWLLPGLGMSPHKSCGHPDEETRFGWAMMVTMVYSGLEWLVNRLLVRGLEHLDYFPYIGNIHPKYWPIFFRGAEPPNLH